LDKIIHHGFPENKKLPSENELANFFGTTRNSVRKVYETLEAMGYISSKQGLGHFPREKRPVIELALRGDVSFSEKMGQQNIPYRSLNVHCKLMDEGSGDERLRQLRGEGELYEVCRLRIVHDVPAALHYSYVSTAMFPDIKAEGRDIGSMFSYYLSKGYRTFTSSGSELSVSFPHSEEQGLLECGELVPLLILESDCRDQTSGKLLELTKIVYRSDRFSYKINV